jgi:hypothetical protein
MADLPFLVRRAVPGDSGREKSEPDWMAASVEPGSRTGLRGEPRSAGTTFAVPSWSRVHPPDAGIVA